MTKKRKKEANFDTVKHLIEEVSFLRNELIEQRKLFSEFVAKFADKCHIYAPEKPCENVDYSPPVPDGESDERPILDNECLILDDSTNSGNIDIPTQSRETAKSWQRTQGETQEHNSASSSSDSMHTCFRVLATMMDF